MTPIDAFFHTVKLPVMSEVAHALIAAMNNEHVSHQEVRDLIAQDASLTARLLRLANSASFGLKRHVTSLDDAISLVGMERVRTLALAASLNDAFPTAAGLDRTEFWHSCLISAGYGQWLSLQLGLDPNDAWLASMMERLGELLIAQANPQALTEIEKLPHVPGWRWERETKLTGFTENQLMAELARRWNFPVTISNALEGADDPLRTKPFNRLAAVVHLATQLADMPPGGDEMLDALPTEVIDALQLRGGWIREKFPAPRTLVAAP